MIARALGVALALAVLAAPAAGAEPEVQAARKCRSVETVNGGAARDIGTSGPVGCRIARRVARRARGGRAYEVGEFRCRGVKIRGPIHRLYNCGRSRNRQVAIVTFKYYLP